MSQINNGYANALFSLALEENNVEKVYHELCALKRVFSSNVEYFSLLSSPTILKEERKRLLKEALMNEFSKNVLTFLLLLCENGKINEYYECVTEYEKLYHQYDNSAVATVKSAIELSEHVKNNIKERFEAISGKKLELNYIIDKTIIGGIIVEINDQIYDGSIKHQLTELKKVIAE